MNSLTPCPSLKFQPTQDLQKEAALGNLERVKEIIQNSQSLLNPKEIQDLALRLIQINEVPSFEIHLQSTRVIAFLTKPGNVEKNHFSGCSALVSAIRSCDRIPSKL